MRPPWVRRTKQGLALLTILFLGGVVGFGLYFMTLVKQAQAQMGTLDERIKETLMTPSEILSADGKVLYSVAEENRIPVKFSDVPKHVRNAIVAAEDKRFYEHAGYDLVGLSRAVVSAVKEQRVSQGGSTLEMQLAKRMYSNSQRTFGRKLQDIAIAATMEKQLSKDQILLLYLNQVYFGERAYGIGAAARIYFNKDVSKLSLAEAAMLARCVRRPSIDTPFYGRTKQQIAANLPSDRSMDNKATVLGVMRTQGMITEEEYKKALKAVPRINPNPPKTTASVLRAPYFVDHVLAMLRRDMPDLDIKAGGYRIETTLDTRMQSLAESQVRKVVNDNRRIGVTTGAFVLMDADGKILAEVGGYDYNKNQTNAVTQGARQPGSAFKPIVYAAALSSGSLGIGESVSNERKSYWDAGARKWYQPHNDSEKFGPYVSLNTALQWSINRCAVNTLAATGVDTVVGYARDAFGIPANRFQGVGAWSYAVALGSKEVSPLEMAEAYSVFALGGDRVEPRPIVSVTGPDGQLIRRYDTVRYNHVLDGSVVEAIDSALQDVVEGGTGTLANVVPNARGKTGTTTDGKDLWFCGYANGLVGVGWVGSEHWVHHRWVYKPMSRGWGGTVTVKIWAGVMKEAVKRYSRSVRKPSDEAPIPAVEVDKSTVTHPAVARNNPETIKPKPIDEGPPPDMGDTQPPVSPDIQPQPDTTTSDQPPVVQDKPKPQPRPRDNPPRETEMVEVEICADSGMRASMYCPETVPRLFPRGKEPKRICTLHRGGGGF